MSSHFPSVKYIALSLFASRRKINQFLKGKTHFHSHSRKNCPSPTHAGPFHLRGFKPSQSANGRKTSQTPTHRKPPETFTKLKQNSPGDAMAREAGGKHLHRYKASNLERIYYSPLRFSFFREGFEKTCQGNCQSNEQERDSELKSSKSLRLCDSF